MATRITALLIAAMVLACAPAQATEVRIKDIARFQGYSDNQLVGYGLVFGLRGSGDGNQILFTAQAIANMLNAQGIKHNRTNIRTRNTASVIVTATLPPFAKPGSKIDVSVSAIGDATSLQGGMLLMTPMRAPNGDVYATAQGSVVVGGFAAGGAGAGVAQNVPTAGNVPNGAIVQREVPTNLQARASLTLVMENYDFTTATRIANVVNEHFGSPLARSRDGASIDVVVPSGFRGKVIDFIAEVERLTVETDERAVVIINEKTGTVVIGQQVRISTCAVAHGNLTIQVSTTFGVSQPQPFSEGQTAIIPQEEVTVTEDMATGSEDAVMMLQEGANIGEIVGALNALGVSPRDVITILQAMKAQGALKAELKVM